MVDGIDTLCETLIVTSPHSSICHLHQCLHKLISVYCNNSGVGVWYSTLSSGFGCQSYIAYFQIDHNTLYFANAVTGMTLGCSLYLLFEGEGSLPRQSTVSVQRCLVTHFYFFFLKKALGLGCMSELYGVGCYRPHL